jgi:di/tricarboxylate transporter
MDFIVNNLDAISLIALAVAIVISIWKKINLGILSLALAFVIGVLLGGKTPKEIVAGYPADLLITLLGISFFFGIANTNGTMDKLMKYAVKSVRGKVGLLPIVIFFAAAIVSSVGAGQISTAAMFASPALLLATETGINPLLMAIMVGCGAQAGIMSPLCPNGIVGNRVIAEMGITEDYSIQFWLHTLVAFLIAALVSYFVYGGTKLWGKDVSGINLESFQNITIEPFDKKQKVTIGAIILLIVLAIGFRLHVGFTALVISSVLLLAGMVNENECFKNIPWKAIVLVTGVSVLVNLMKNIGGLDLFSSIIASISTPFTVTLVVGFIAALVSAYASTSGVILPAFLPMVPSLVDKLGGGPSMVTALIFTVVVAGHLTDVSPLSTTGAVIVAGAPKGVNEGKLYSGLLIFGFAMSVFAALYCWIAYTILGVGV